MGNIIEGYERSNRDFCIKQGIWPRMGDESMKKLETLGIRFSEINRDDDISFCISRGLEDEYVQVYNLRWKDNIMPFMKISGAGPGSTGKAVRTDKAVRTGRTFRIGTGSTGSLKPGSEHHVYYIVNDHDMIIARAFVKVCGNNDYAIASLQDPEPYTMN